MCQEPAVTIRENMTHPMLYRKYRSEPFNPGVCPMTGCLADMFQLIFLSKQVCVCAYVCWVGDGGRPLMNETAVPFRFSPIRPTSSDPLFPTPQFGQQLLFSGPIEIIGKRRRVSI